MRYGGAHGARRRVHPAGRAEPGRPDLTDRYDLGQATFAILVAAADLGIGTGHSAVGDQDEARSILKVPGSHTVAYLIGIGYPADRPLHPVLTPARRPFDEVVHWGTFTAPH